MSFSCCVGESTIAAHWHLLIFSWLQINGAPQRGQIFSFMGIDVLVPVTIKWCRRVALSWF